MNGYLQASLLFGILLLTSVLQANTEWKDGAQSEADNDSHSLQLSQPVTLAQSPGAEVPPKPTVFDPSTLQLKQDTKQVQKENKENTVTEVVKTEKNLPVLPEIKSPEPNVAVSARPVYQEAKKSDDFFNTLAVTKNRSKKWFTENFQKTKNLFQREETKKKPVSERNAYEQGFAAEQRQDYSAAVRLYKAYISENKIEKSEDERINADLAAPYYRLAMIAWSNNERDNAESYFREATSYALGNNRFIVAGDFSRFLLEQKKIKEAEVVIRNIMIDYPNNKGFQLSLAKCLALQDRPVESLRYFAAVYDDDKEKAYEELANVYRSQNRGEMAQIAERKREEFVAESRGSYSSYPVLAAAKPVPVSEVKHTALVPRTIPFVSEQASVNAVAEVKPVPPEFYAEKPKNRSRYVPFLTTLPKLDTQKEQAEDKNTSEVPVARLNLPLTMPKEQTENKNISRVETVVSADYSALLDYSILSPIRYSVRR